MTEEELREKGVGECIMAQDPQWAVKKELYQNQGVWHVYTSCTGFYDRKHTEIATGWTDTRAKRAATQNDVDNYLLAKARGEKPDIPKPWINEEKAAEKKAESKKDPVDPLMNVDDLPEETSTVDMVETITYVFNNMDVDNIDPKDAPSRGAYFYLMRIRKDVTAKNKFYEQGLMKLVPTSAQLKEAGQKNDDGRDTFELLDRLLRECTNSQG